MENISLYLSKPFTLLQPIQPQQEHDSIMLHSH